jgi:RimJ/RimL family protein N-acetyltransferase
MEIYIRPLREEDALTSWKWRNDPEVWKLTGSRPDRYITEELELSWIKRVLQDQSTKRFAICVSGTDKYIGNVQLTDITGECAEFHIFIGDRSCWGKGVSTQATRLILDYAWNVLLLKSVFLCVNKDNVAAIRSYEKNGFTTINCDDRDLTMEAVRCRS